MRLHYVINHDFVTIQMHVVALAWSHSCSQYYTNLAHVGIFFLTNLLVWIYFLLPQIKFSSHLYKMSNDKKNNKWFFGAIHALICAVDKNYFTRFEF